ncbi:DUF3320 domain-containing protein [Methylobacterium sp. BTF04]|nr:DUF3320 domain-containing protein [Methylobacterium sp. BTF04]
MPDTVEAPDSAAACRIACATIGHLGTAVWQSAVPVIREITLENTGGDDLCDVALTLTAAPAILRPLTLTIDRIAAGGLYRIVAPRLSVDAAALANLRESGLCRLTLVAQVGDAEIGREAVDLRLLPPAHWGGAEAAPELLAAFVRPNDPAVDALLHATAGHLLRAGRSSALDGYRGGTKARTWEVAQALYAALADLGLTYVLPPASFERVGQKVRSPGEILDRRVATCLDLTLLMAACFEQAGLNPLVVLTQGHACIGLWLGDTCLPQAVGDDAQALRKRRDLDDLILIETTLLTQAPPARFGAALAAGARHIDEDAVAPFEMVLDLRRARAAGIRPLDAGDAPRSESAPIPNVPRSQAFEAAPNFVEDRPPQPDPRPEPPRDRLETWKRRLLDLTLRNRLLNFKPGKASVALQVPEPNALAARLAEGGHIRLVAQPETGEHATPTQIVEVGEILTTSQAEDLETRLTDLFRLARTGLEEGGANVLHLAFGFLVWTRGGAMAPVRAPLFLVPVALTRTSVRAGFRLVRYEAEAGLNPTLIEMLRQDFSLTLPDFDAVLPGDGIDVEAVWRMVRGAVRDLKGFEVVPEVALSTFAFTKVLMWKDLAERTDLLKRNRLVRHLLETPTLSYGGAEGFPAPERLDAEHPPQTVFTPLSADSSQLAAILAAAAGKDFVLFGPPGTGKSQTIANMITQCLALGRTVLFVSQKTAALDVVRRRLDAVGLGACCLEVHAAKAQKTHVLGQLREAWSARGAETVPWEDASADLARHRDALNGVVDALHASRENGVNAHAALGRVIADGASAAPRLSLSWPDHTSHTPETLAALRAHATTLATLLPAVGAVADHPLRGIGAVEWSPLWRAEMERAIAELSRSLPPFADAVPAFAEALGLTGMAETWDGARAVVALSGALFRPEARAGLRFAGPDGALLRQALEARRLHEVARAERESRLSGQYADSVHDADPARLLSEWRAAKGANLLLRGSRLKRIRRMLEADARGPLPPDLGTDLATLVELGRLRMAGPMLAGTLERAFSELGPPWSDPSLPADGFTAAVTWANRIAPVLAHLAPQGGGPDALRSRLGDLIGAGDGRMQPGGALMLARETLADTRRPALRALEALNRLAGRDRLDQPLGVGPGWSDTTLAIAARWAAALPKAQAWTGWRCAARDAAAIGLGPLVEASEAGTVPADDIPAAFEGAYARWWIDHVVTHDSRLRSFRGPGHAAEIARFRAADTRLGALAGAAVRARIGAVPDANAFGADPEWGTLAREIAKRARHLPLRTLFARMPNALTRLTPCVMMSPLSIAQHWPADAPPFDVVIFDEASQITPWDAIGAIARGRQTVIVGDPEQLPPTSVGERIGEDGPDTADVPDQESILDECLAADLPRMRLSWHYRSRHESLIAFSNRHYYRGGLITFPSPVTADRAVRLITVADGLYERGAARVNRPEARAVVADVVARLRDPGLTDSLGIVTFNGEQQRLIENLLDAERRADPGLDRHFDPRTSPEPVFVKNLETVQGDERDVILFSVAVGPDGAGRITGQISSLNREGGHRRLNVAITRARRALLVFASLLPEQIDLGRGTARGIRDFKHFLEFAERGAPALDAASAPTGRDVESPFEASVMAALEARGWRVVPQVGVSSFRIDLGIVHPDAPGRYLAGVECDGATYHSAATARDRDRLRHGILTGLGWRLHRVWSTDWWIDADGALARLDAGLRADLDADRAVPIPEAPSLYAERPAPPPLYRMADLTGLEPEAARFHDPAYDARLAAMVDAVIVAEGPVFFELLVARLMRAHGLARTTARLRDRVLGLIDGAVVRSVEDERLVLWPPDAEPSRPVRFRPAEGEARDVADIPLAELAGLAAALDPDGVSDDMPERMAGSLGIGRLREATRARLERAVVLARATEHDSDPEADRVESC